MNATAEIKEQEAGPGGPFPDQFAYLSDGVPALTAGQVGLVPGVEVPLMAVDLPAALRGHAREQVAERQVRDALASGRDTLEVRPFITSGTAHDWTRVLVADHDRLAAWRHMAGSACKAVLPDYLALPTGAEIWSLAGSDEVVLARLGPKDGFSASPAVAVRLLRDALAAADPAPKAVFSPDHLRPEIGALFETLGVPVADSAEALKTLGLEPPRVLTHGELALDLRRDPRAARVQLRRAVLPWRWPVLVGLLAAGLWTGAQMLAIHGAQDQIDQARAATLNTVRTHFVPSGPVLDIRTQVSRALAEARVSAAGAGENVSPLDLLGLAADVMTDQTARPDYVDYTRADGLKATVRVKDFASADDLAAALRDAGLVVTVVESRVSDGDDAVRTELHIAAPDPTEAGE